MWGQSCLFPPLALPVIKTRISQSQHYVHGSESWTRHLPRLLGKRTMEITAEELLLTPHMVTGTRNQHQSGRSSAQKCSAGTPDPTGICSIAPVSLISSLNKVLHVTTQVSSSTLARGCPCRWRQPEMPLLDPLGSSKPADNSDCSE